MTGVILLGPSGSGKDTIISQLARRNIASAVARHSTRKARLFENGHLISISFDDFMQRKANGEHIALSHFAGNYYGVPVSEIAKTLNRKENPVFTTYFTEVEKTKIDFAKLFPSVKLVTFYLVTDPEDSWIKNLQARKLKDIEERIKLSNLEKEAVFGSHKYLVDHYLTNYFNDLNKTINEMVEKLDQS